MSVSRRSFAFDLASLCAPTLAGLKPASLFRYQPGAGQSGSAMAAAWHAALCDRGVAVRVLKNSPRTGAVLVYVYRPAQMDILLKNCDVLHFFCKVRATAPARRTRCWRSFRSGFAARGISPTRSASSWATRWRTWSGLSKTTGKISPPAVTGRSTPTLPLRSSSSHATKNAKPFTPAATGAARPSGG